MADPNRIQRKQSKQKVQNYNCNSVAYEFANMHTLFIRCVKPKEVRGESVHELTNLIDRIADVKSGES